MTLLAEHGLDGLGDLELDQVARLAAAVCGTPRATVNLLDDAQPDPPADAQRSDLQAEAPRPDLQPDAPRPDLLTLPPRWVTLRGETTHEGRTLRSVTLVDEAVALTAPHPGFALQVGIGVRLAEPDASGQPGPEEKAVLRRFEAGLVQALGPAGRLVASLTVDGVREYLAYVAGTDVLLPWREAAPAGMDSHDWQVQVLEDPRWLGLREIAGLLEAGEELSAPLVEVQPPGSAT